MLNLLKVYGPLGLAAGLIAVSFVLLVTSESFLNLVISLILMLAGFTLLIGLIFE